MASLLVVVLAAALLGTLLLLAYRRHQRHRRLNPVSHMRLSDQDVARLAKASVIRFLDDDQRGIRPVRPDSRYSRRN